MTNVTAFVSAITALCIAVTGLLTALRAHGKANVNRTDIASVKAEVDNITNGNVRVIPPDH